MSPSPPDSPPKRRRGRPRKSAWDKWLAKLAKYEVSLAKLTVPQPIEGEKWRRGMQRTLRERYVRTYLNPPLEE